MKRKRGGSGSITTGAIGTYLAAGELVRRGFIVSALSQTAKGVDILAFDAKTLWPVGIQVKATGHRSRVYLLRAAHERIYAPGLFYVFVNLPNAAKGWPAQFCVVPSKAVATYVRRSHAAWLKRRSRTGAKHRDSDMRLFRDPKGRWVDRWNLLKKP